MDWKQLGQIVAPLAPVAGSILGGFLPIPGGSIIGQKLGSLVAQAFGLPATATPGQISDAIATAGEETARAKINAAVEVARAQIVGFTEIEKATIEALSKAVVATNETMRAETDARTRLLLAGIKDHWFFSAWRPAAAWVFITTYAGFGVMLLVATAIEVASSPNPLQTLKDAWPLYLAYFGPGGLIVGVLIPSRSAEKVAAVAAVTPPLAPPALPAPNQRAMPLPVPRRMPAPPIGQAGQAVNQDLTRPVSGGTG